eukprot:gnl/TRDRNA2_/TRDRNA2_202638_c0_seq1.p1 gnl/TRDRNA2_/TRDRNA2_202638_c0~~gnl/TRDRNA2_/TRDRNA2_202638_c0_seq1.p1  ORF type:complete len:327 (+),score=30.54 gnl/TRDRNA2_/TRDRNA2_202638_c0_seq1:75-1055(+)
MPIKVPSGLPACEVLECEGVRIVSHELLITKDIRPLHVALLNLMPNKERTETQFARLLGASPLNVTLTLIRMSSHESRNTSASYLGRFYVPFSEAKTKRYDALIITGAPVEVLPFEEVDYWAELQEVFEWSRTSSHMTMAICWAAQAMLYHFYRVPKHQVSRKRFGCAKYRNLVPGSPYLRGFSDEFFVPVSRYTECYAEDLPTDAGLQILCNSEVAGLCLVEDPRHRVLYMFNHIEYDTMSLKEEYDRDIARGLDVHIPENYYPEDDPSNPPLNTWRCHAHLLYSNWLGEISQNQMSFAVPVSVCWTLDDARDENRRPSKLCVMQ